MRYPTRVCDLLRGVGDGRGTAKKLCFAVSLRFVRYRFRLAVVTYVCRLSTADLLMHSQSSLYLPGTKQSPVECADAAAANPLSFVSNTLIQCSTLV